MGGVDKHDMLRQLYEINRKSMKWWHRLVFGSLDMAVVNTYVVHNASKQGATTFIPRVSKRPCNGTAYSYIC